MPMTVRDIMGPGAGSYGNSNVPPHLRAVNKAPGPKAESLTSIATSPAQGATHEIGVNPIGERKVPRVHDIIGECNVRGCEYRQTLIPSAPQLANIQPSGTLTGYPLRQSDVNQIASPTVTDVNGAGSALTSPTKTDFNGNGSGLASPTKTNVNGAGSGLDLPSAKDKVAKVTESANMTKNKSAWVPPHLRAKGPVAMTTADPVKEEDIVTPSHQYLAETAETASDTSTATVQNTSTVQSCETDNGNAAAATQKTSSEQSHQANIENVAAAPESPQPARSPDPIGESILLHIEAIAITGYLDLDTLMLLYGLRDKVIAQIAGKAAAGDSSPPVELKTTSTLTPNHSSHIAPEAVATTDASAEYLQNMSLNASTSPAKKLDPKHSTSDDTKSKPDAPGPVSSPSTSSKLRLNTHTDATKAAPAKIATVGINLSRVTSIEEGEDREHKVYFDSWGVQEKRDVPAAKVRTVAISNLPPNATPAFVASLVYGGPVEYINLRPADSGALTASVRFMKADDCMAYYDKTSNGVVYKTDDSGQEKACYVYLRKDVDVVGGLLNVWIEQGVTRCVRAVGVEEDWSIDGLRQLAEKKGRKLEGISVSKNPRSARSVVWRFCKVEDAATFKSALIRDLEWEQCNIHFANDPCATATGVHLHD